MSLRHQGIVFEMHNVCKTYSYGAEISEHIPVECNKKDIENGNLYLGILYEVTFLVHGCMHDRSLP